MRIRVCRARLKLIRSGELRDGDFVLVGMAGPGAIHQANATSFFLSSASTFSARAFSSASSRLGIKRGHAADREHAVLVADLRHQFAQILEERHVVRNRVAVGQHPLRIFEIEMDQAGHVIPAAEIQAENVVAQIPGELLHLEGQRMRFDQRHALDGIRWQALGARNHLEKIAPPQRLVRRLRFRNVEAQRMLAARRNPLDTRPSPRRTATPVAVRLEELRPGEDASRAAA